MGYCTMSRREMELGLAIGVRVCPVSALGQKAALPPMSSYHLDSRHPVRGSGWSTSPGDLRASHNAANLCAKVENVGCRFVSLRQFLVRRNSPGRNHGHIRANNHGTRRAKLRRGPASRRPENLSLGPIVSKPPDSGDLVRIF